MGAQVMVDQRPADRPRYRQTPRHSTPQSPGERGETRSPGLCQRDKWSAVRKNSFLSTQGRTDAFELALPSALLAPFDLAIFVLVV